MICQPGALHPDATDGLPRCWITAALTSLNDHGTVETMTVGEAVPTAHSRPARRTARPFIFGGVVFTVLTLLFGVPWWTVAVAADWPGAWGTAATVLFACALLAFPALMFFGHGRRLDWAARIADTTLGVIWVLFAWSVIGNIVLRSALVLAGVDEPIRSRAVAIAVLIVAFGLSVWGSVEAMRVPRVKRVDVTIDRLGPGLDGMTVALLTDTHYGPIDRARWAARVAQTVNRLEPDIVCHTGDIADGTVGQRISQAQSLGSINAKHTRAYVTGNHEYYSEAAPWIAYMSSIGWQALENRHLVVEHGGDRLVVAGIDDATARTSDLQAALTGADPDLPVLLLAHQPKQVALASAAGVDLQLSGHTHGGQIWPFRYLVQLDQPSVAGLSRHGSRTQLYTSRGTGFWGPPLRVFAPSEITLITLRSPAAGG